MGWPAGQNTSVHPHHFGHGTFQVWSPSCTSSQPRDRNARKGVCLCLCLVSCVCVCVCICICICISHLSLSEPCLSPPTSPVVAFSFSFALAFFFLPLPLIYLRASITILILILIAAITTSLRISPFFLLLLLPSILLLLLLPPPPTFFILLRWLDCDLLFIPCTLLHPHTIIVSRVSMDPSFPDATQGKYMYMFLIFSVYNQRRILCFFFPWYICRFLELGG